MQLTIPESALVVLIGPSGAGKSTFARHHFRPTEVLSSDACRALVADDEADQAATPAAFEVLHCIAAKRLAAGRFPLRAARLAYFALCFVSGLADDGGGGRWTPARRAFERPIAMACFVDRAPCFPSRT